MEDLGFCVYVHKFKNGTVYVGKGRARRARQFNKSRRNIYWCRLFDKYGEPLFRVISSGLSEDVALNLERDILERLRAKGRATCNIIFAENNPEISEEKRLKMSQSRRGELSPTWGMIHSDKAKEKISKANKGRFVGRLSPRYKSDVFEFVHLDGRKFSGTQSDFSVFSDVSQPQASLLCKGKSDSAKGWRLAGTKLKDTGLKGKRHGRFDHTLFNFIHKSGIKETCTKYDLYTKYNLNHPCNLAAVCNGKIKSYKGWSINKAVET